MVGHKTEAIYRRYATAEEKMLIEAADKLEKFQKLTSNWKLQSNSKVNECDKSPSKAQRR